MPPWPDQPPPPVSGCIRALWSEVARDAETLESAYALDAITQEVIYTAGPLLVGFVAVLISPTVSMIMCAAITVTGTGLFATYRSPGAGSVPQPVVPESIL